MEIKEIPQQIFQGKVKTLALGARPETKVQQTVEFAISDIVFPLKPVNRHPQNNGNQRKPYHAYILKGRKQKIGEVRKFKNINAPSVIVGMGKLYCDEDKQDVSKAEAEGNIPAEELNYFAVQGCVLIFYSSFCLGTNEYRNFGNS